MLLPGAESSERIQDLLDDRIWRRVEKEPRDDALMPRVLTRAIRREVVPSTEMRRPTGEIRVGRSKSSLTVRMNNFSDKTSII